MIWTLHGAQGENRRRAKKFARRLFFEVHDGAVGLKMV